jgi:hypothetical protein
MFRLYRTIQPGEFFVVFADGAQGGEDKNFIQFLSKTHADFPLVYSSRGVTTETVPVLRQALDYIYKQTKVKPVVAYERNMGGASAITDLYNSNVEGHYTCYFMRDSNGIPTDKLGWDTNLMTRPKMLGEYLTAYNSKLFTIYDKETQEQHQTFIVNKNGKPEAAPNTHDDAVMSCAGAWQLYQSENPPSVKKHTRSQPKRLKFQVG